MSISIYITLRSLSGFMHGYIHTCVYVYMRVYTHTKLYVYSHIDTYMYVCLYIYIYIYTYVYICIDILAVAAGLCHSGKYCLHVYI